MSYRLAGIFPCHAHFFALGFVTPYGSVHRTVLLYRAANYRFVFARKTVRLYLLRKPEKMEKIEFIAVGGIRLDKLISENTELSRSAAARLIEQGRVKKQQPNHYRKHH